MTALAPATATIRRIPGRYGCFPAPFPLPCWRKIRVLLTTTGVSRHKLSGPSAAGMWPSSCQGWHHSTSRKAMPVNSRTLG